MKKSIFTLLLTVIVMGISNAQDGVIAYHTTGYTEESFGKMEELLASLLQNR